MIGVTGQESLLGLEEVEFLVSCQNGMLGGWSVIGAEQDTARYGGGKYIKHSNWSLT